MPETKLSKVNDIKAYYQNMEFGANDYIDTEEVETFIVETEALVLRLIGSKYTIPSDIATMDTIDQLLIKQIVDRMVVHKIDGIIREKDSEGRFVFSRNLGKDGQTILDKILSGELVLSAAKKKSVFKFNNVDSNSETVEKHFQKRDGTVRTMRV
jgi:hypothetical protein